MRKRRWTTVCSVTVLAVGAAVFAALALGIFPLGAQPEGVRTLSLSRGPAPPARGARARAATASRSAAAEARATGTFSPIPRPAPAPGGLRREVAEEARTAGTALPPRAERLGLPEASAASRASETVEEALALTHELDAQALSAGNPFPAEPDPEVDARIAAELDVPRDPDSEARSAHLAAETQESTDEALALTRELDARALDTDNRFPPEQDPEVDARIAAEVDAPAEPDPGSDVAAPTAEAADATAEDLALTDHLDTQALSPASIFPQEPHPEVDARIAAEIDVGATASPHVGEPPDAIDEALALTHELDARALDVGSLFPPEPHPEVDARIIEELEAADALAEDPGAAGGSSLAPPGNTAVPSEALPRP